MSDFRYKLINDVLRGNENKDKTKTIAATVIDTKPLKISFIDENGEKKDTEKVTLRSYGNDTTGTYEPEVNDEVICEYEDNKYTIIGKQTKPREEAKADLTLASDKYTNMVYDSWTGYIF